MTKLIRLKHWQVFSIIAIGYIISIVLQINKFEIGSITSLELSAVATIITIILLFSWSLTIGLFLNQIPEKAYHFKSWILIMAVFFCIIGYTDLNLQRIGIENNFVPFWVGFIIMPMTFWGLYFTFYNVAKSLKSIELEREAKFSECIIDAISLFVLPIGVWFIQPRLNKILAITENTKTEIEAD